MRASGRAPGALQCSRGYGSAAVDGEADRDRDDDQDPADDVLPVVRDGEQVETVMTQTLLDSWPGGARECRAS